MGGLALVALGTGGIKPCVSSFGGDQFAADATREKEIFFSVFYAAINAGSVLSTVITPIMKREFNYAFAFALPAGLLGVALLLFGT